MDDVTQPSGFMEESVPYSSMKEVNLVVSSAASTSSASYWDPSATAASTAALVSNAPNASSTSAGSQTQHHCLIRIVLPEGCLLLQVNTHQLSRRRLVHIQLVHQSMNKKIGQLYDVIET